MGFPSNPSGFRPSFVRPELWNRVNLLEEARARSIGSDRLTQVTRPVFSTGISDPRHCLRNEYSLYLASRQTLSTPGLVDRVFIDVGKLCGKPENWRNQRQFLSDLFCRFFDCSSEQMGWVSLLGVRRPQAERSIEDSHISIGRAHPDRGPRIANRSYELDDPICVNTLMDVRLSGATFAVGSGKACPKLQRITFENHVARDSYHTAVREWWYVPCRDWDDTEILKQRRIPFLDQQGHYEVCSASGLSTTLLINLVKIIGHGMAEDCTLEICPKSGGILSIRGYQTTLAGLFLLASTVEEFSIADAFLGYVFSD